MKRAFKPSPPPLPSHSFSSASPSTKPLTLSHYFPRQHPQTAARPIQLQSRHNSALMSNQTESSSISPASVVLGGESKKRKRRKSEKSVIDDRTRWRSESEQRIYSTKLLNALRFVHNTNQNDIASTSSSSNQRKIRAAADRVLAVTAKGRTRWSRAILKHRRFRSKILNKVNTKIPKKSAPSKTMKSTTGTSELVVKPEVEKRVKVLGRLVPGCRKASLTNLLEETTDYIAALEMQVRAMAALAQLLASGGGAGVGTSGSNLTSGS